MTVDTADRDAQLWISRESTESCGHVRKRPSGGLADQSRNYWIRLSVRLHAALHSRLVMCVSASQKPMQSLNVLPPPPGALGAFSLGLPGDSAKLFRRGTLPPDEKFEGCCGDNGAMPGAWGAGVPIADDGGVAGVLGVGIGASCGVVDVDGRAGAPAPPVERD
jgi:hypothetical protein